MRFSQTRNSHKVSQPCGLKDGLLCSRPLWACSHLENRELSHFCIAHCVRWVARLYQKTSLVLYRWVTQARPTGLPEACTCPATLDRPNDLLCSRPLWACSHLENRELSHLCIAHCVRWVAQLHQKPSLSCHRWVMTGQDDWTSRRLHSPISDGPVHLGARSLHLSCHTAQARTTGLRTNRQNCQLAAVSILRRGGGCAGVLGRCGVTPVQ